jgi:hypothetical protein
MPTKQLRTSKELEVMIKARSNIPGIILAVNHTPVYGWQVKVVNAPVELIKAKQIVDRIAAELRLLYDLST